MHTEVRCPVCNNIAAKRHCPHRWCGWIICNHCAATGEMKGTPVYWNPPSVVDLTTHKLYPYRIAASGPVVF